jgi:RND family efflux transporter MFP subunit
MRQVPWAVPLLLSLLIGCAPGKEPDKEGSATPTSSSAATTATPTPVAQAGAIPKVVVGTVQRKDISVSKEYTAQTVASQTIDVKPRVVGTLLDFTFREGTRVYAGQHLFSIDPAPFIADLRQAEAGVLKAVADLHQAQNQVDVKRAEADVAQARSKLQQTQLDVDRYKPLALQQIIPQQTYDQAVTNRNVARSQLTAQLAVLQNTKLRCQSDIAVAKAQLEGARAQVTSAQIKLDYCAIVAPVTGVIGRLGADPGNIVSPADPDPMAVISQSDPMYVEFGISETEYLGLSKRLSKIQSGAATPEGRVPFKLLLADGTEYNRRGTFMMTERGLDSKTGTLLVRTSFPNSEGKLVPGQFARVQVAADGNKSEVLVPQVAVTEMQSLQAVYLVGPDKKVESRTIVTNGTYEDSFIVSEGLKGGEMVIVEGLQKVRPGQLCEPTDSPAVVK